MEPGTHLTPTAAPPLSVTECRMSERLRTLLLTPGARSEAVEAIANTPSLRDEARLTLRELEATIAPAGPERVKAALAPMIAVFGVSEATRTATWWKAYYDQLADLPAHALADAATAYMSLPDSEFFPKPGPFRALALKAAEPAFTALGRVREALRTPPAPERKVLDFDGARVAAETRKLLEASRKDTFPRRVVSPSAPPPIPTDEHGLSSAMRAKLGCA